MTSPRPLSWMWTGADPRWATDVCGPSWRAPYGLLPPLRAVVQAAALPSIAEIVYLHGRAGPRAGRGSVSALEGRGAVVAEGLVALAHRLLETGLRGPLLEGVALAGVTGDSVKDGPEDLCLVQALGIERLVDEQLHHLQLVERVAGDPLDQHLGALVELGVDGRLDREAPLERLGARQR